MNTVLLLCLAPAPLPPSTDSLIAKLGARDVKIIKSTISKFETGDKDTFTKLQKARISHPNPRVRYNADIAFFRMLKNYRFEPPKGLNQLPYIDSLPDDIPNKQQIIDNNLNKVGYVDPVSWNNYRAATKFYLIDLAYYEKKSIEDIEELLEKMMNNELSK